MSKQIVIIGATHTGITLAKKLMHLDDVDVSIYDTRACPDRNLHNIYSEVSSIEDAILGDASIYFVTYDDDSMNVKTCLSINRLHKSARILTMIAQESLGNKVQMCVPNLQYINPAKRAAFRFVDAALDNLSVTEETKFKWPRIRVRLDSLVKKAIAFIISIMTASTVFFHYMDDLSWVDSFYFTVTMMATVGFGDFSMRDHSTTSKLFACAVMLSSVTGTAMIFALFSDSIIRRRKELSMGRSSYTGHNHVIVVGSGSVGFNVVKRLIELGEKPVVLDQTLDGRYSQNIVDLDVPHLVGNAKDESNLFRAGLGACKALICVTQDDLTNLEVGLDARTARPDLRVVLRIYDQNLSSNLAETAAIKHSLSMSAIAAEEFIEMIKLKII